MSSITYYTKMNGEYIPMPEQPVELHDLSYFGLEMVENIKMKTFEIQLNTEMTEKLLWAFRKAFDTAVPNNWLKMHGFPMRRKRGGKK